MKKIIIALVLISSGCASVGVRTIGHQHIKIEVGEPCKEGAK